MTMLLNFDVLSDFPLDFFLVASTREMEHSEQSPGIAGIPAKAFYECRQTIHFPGFATRQRTLPATVLRNKLVRSQLAVKATETVSRNLRAAGMGFGSR